MISDKTMGEIIELSTKHLTDQLSAQAYQQVVESLCLPRCGKTPDAELCPRAEGTHRRFIALLFNSYSRLN